MAARRMRKTSVSGEARNAALQPHAHARARAECGGGVTQRLREVKVAMKFGGKPCGETSETKACNGQACEKNCELSGWTKWSACTKDCDGGTKKRQKFVKKEAEGEGKCPGAWSLKRLQYEKCNQHRCPVPKGKLVMECNRSMDIVLLIDGSGSLGKKGWAAEIKAANMFIDAFSGSGGKSNMAVILYSGPRTWGGVRKCFAKNKKKVDQEKVWGIKMITHFTEDLKKSQKFDQWSHLAKREHSDIIGFAYCQGRACLGPKTITFQYSPVH